MDEWKTYETLEEEVLCIEKIHRKSKLPKV